MVSKNQIKLINSLQQKKYRNEYQLFIAEGIKVIQELFQSQYIAEHFYTTNPDLSISAAPIPEIIAESDLKKISCLKTPNDCLAVFRIPKTKPINLTGLVVCLDDVRDPGNLGTIIRIADWYGIQKIICSEGTVDLYNPKVISSTMGSFTRVSLFYTDLVKYLKGQQKPIYGAFLDSENVHTLKFAPSGYIIIGNEANGISEAVEEVVTHKITIPRFGGAESLNAGIATAVICDNLRR